MREYNKIKCLFRISLRFQEANLGFYDNGLLTCPQGILTTLKWLLAYGANRADDRISSEISYKDVFNILLLIIMIADYLPKDEVENYKIEFCNAAQYFGTQKVIKHELARSYNVFVINQVKLPDYINDSFVEKYGISIEEYLANSFGFFNYAFVNNNFWDRLPGHPISNFDAKYLQDSYNKYIKMMSLSFEESKKKANDSLNKKWDFSWMLQFPLLIINNYACPIDYFTFSYVW